LYLSLISSTVAERNNSVKPCICWIWMVYLGIH